MGNVQRHIIIIFIQEEGMYRVQDKYDIKYPSYLPI